jgi:hypothetical protein
MRDLATVFILLPATDSDSTQWGIYTFNIFSFILSRVLVAINGVWVDDFIY